MGEGGEAGWCATLVRWEEEDGDGGVEVVGGVADDVLLVVLWVGMSYPNDSLYDREINFELF